VTPASLAAAAGLGFASGLRTFQGLAWVARSLAGRAPDRDGPALERWLGRPGIARLLAVLAAGELAVDKMPGVPDRIRLPPLTGRALAGAAAGGLAAGRDRRAAGAALGAGGAVLGAFTGWYLRREAARATTLPDIAVALLEDALAVSVSRRIARRIQFTA
jgi:uncharacterized membrane protein